LEESWGNRTTGLDIVPNEARKVKPEPEKHTSTLPQDETYKSAFRRLAYGEKISDILTCENVTSRVAREMQSEYGLSGRVYIRASDFPGIFNGRWNEVIKKRCASAQYIISDEGCAFDRYLGMGVVASEGQIPWKKVHASLMPKLETCGVSKTSTSDHRSALKQAFIDLTEGDIKSAEMGEAWYHILPDATQGLSYKQASEALARAQVDNPYIETQEQRELSKVEQRLSIIAQQLIAQDMVESEIVSEVVKSDRTASAKIERLYQIASKPSVVSDYNGLGTRVKAHVSEKKREQVSIEDPSLSEARQVTAHYVKQAREMLQSGQISLKDLERVTSGVKTASDKIKAIASFINAPKTSVHQGEQTAFHGNHVRKQILIDKKAGEVKALSEIKRLIESGRISIDDVEKVTSIHKSARLKLNAVLTHIASAKKSDYEGVEYSAHVSERTASFSTEDPNRVKIATWLRTKMTEGSAGEEIDQMMRARFASDLIEVNKSLIEDTRSAHEGLSGHIYVDSEAYMTDSGTVGCDKGAMTHRANQIPTILKSARCGTCVFNSQGTCQKYAKPLIASVNEVLEDAKSYQNENIRLANGTDADRTASLFVNEYDPSEFGLSSDGSLALNGTPSAEQLEDVLFGGFEV